MGNFPGVLFFLRGDLAGSFFTASSNACSSVIASTVRRRVANFS